MTLAKSAGALRERSTQVLVAETKQEGTHKFNVQARALTNNFVLKFTLPFLYNLHTPQAALNPG